MIVYFCGVVISFFVGLNIIRKYRNFFEINTEDDKISAVLWTGLASTLWFLTIPLITLGALVLGIVSLGIKIIGESNED